jgi:tryptophan synthase beta chain
MASDNFSFPDKEGFFGEYGGKFVPETLMYALEELENTYNQLKDNKEFIDEFYKDLSAFVGRPSPLIFCSKTYRSLWFWFNLVKERRSQSYRCS